MLDLRRDKKDTDILSSITRHSRDKAIAVILPETPTKVNESILIGKTPTLFVMDYSPEEFDKRNTTPNTEQDPYDILKREALREKIATQGIHQDNLKEEKAMKRNLDVCLYQLALKEVVLQRTPWPLHSDILQNTIFTHQNHILYYENKAFHFLPWDAKKLTELLIKKGLSSPDEAEKLLQHIVKRNSSNTQKKLGERRLLFSKSSVIEIIDTQERVCFYPEDIHENLINRETPIPWDSFLIKEGNAQNKSITEDQVALYNHWLKSIEKKELNKISYDDLLKKYKKDIQEHLGFGRDTHSLRSLMQLPFKIKGKKEDKVTINYQGIWYSESDRGYYVGKKHGYNQKQDRGFVWRRILTHCGHFDRESFFSLLSVPFIRYEEYTVYPYPFKLIAYLVEAEQSSDF